MIQQVFDGMITLMLAKLVLNDVPHFLYSETTHRVIRIVPTGPPRRAHQESISGVIPTGTCYEDAWRFLFRRGEGFLIHGSLQLTAEGGRINHAWVELLTKRVWEPQTGRYFTVKDFNRMFAPIEDARYSVEEAAIMLARVGKHGPWSIEERSMWL